MYILFQQHTGNATSSNSLNNNSNVNIESLSRRFSDADNSITISEDNSHQLLGESYSSGSDSFSEIDSVNDISNGDEEEVEEEEEEEKEREKEDE